VLMLEPCVLGGTRCHLVAVEWVNTVSTPGQPDHDTVPAPATAKSINSSISNSHLLFLFFLFLTTKVGDDETASVQKLVFSAPRGVGTMLKCSGAPHHLFRTI
jgi:hypothetical protein